MNCEIVDLVKLECSFTELISVKTDSIKDEGVTFNEYLILPKYGQGSIISLELDDIFLSISRFMLNDDLVIYNRGGDDLIQLSFLIEGEKIIYLKNLSKDILYENQESYLASIKDHDEHTRISGRKPFKEVKIKFTKNFLINHGFNSDFLFKKLSDINLIIPITNDLFNVLNDLEGKSLKGITRKLFLEAKILELLAIQIENYKNIDLNKLIGVKDKNIKKLYVVKQIMKENLGKNFSIKELSREVALNENILKKEFKRVFGCSINQFSTDEKMDRAKDLLQSTQLPIYQIAEEIGYKNATHFSAAFKRCFGETPKKFRYIL